MCNEWANDFVAFYEYVTKLPNYGEPGISLDRINNDRDYEPGNIRWATNHIQSCNRRKRKNKSSDYTGVYKHLRKYRAHIRVNHKIYDLGVHATPEAAVSARNDFIRKNALHEYEIQPLKS